MLAIALAPVVANPANAVDPLKAWGMALKLPKKPGWLSFDVLLRKRNSPPNLKEWRPRVQLTVSA